MDAYHWTVLYKDGTVHQQIVDGVDTGDWSTVEVNHVDRVIAFPHDDELPIHGVRIPDGKRAFLTFRRNIQLDPNTGIQSPTPTVLIIGWEDDQCGSYLVIDFFGNTALTDTKDGEP